MGRQIFLSFRISSGWSHIRHRCLIFPCLVPRIRSSRLFSGRVLVIACCLPAGKPGGSARVGGVLMKEMKRSSSEIVCSRCPPCTGAPQRNSCAVDSTVWEALLGAPRSRQKKEFSMRTMTIAELNQQIDLALERLSVCRTAPHYCAWPISSKSQAEAEALLIEARKKRNAKFGV
jgi:hypothetical protein